MAENDNQKPTIEYPCHWAFKVIGLEETAVCLAIDKCLEDCLAGDMAKRGIHVGGSRESRGGKYVSVSLSLQVASEEERNALFQALANRPEVRIVI